MTTPYDAETLAPNELPPGAITASTERFTLPGYELLGKLGQGGMGVVYKARQIRLNRTVALKMVLHAEHVGEQERSRFLAEAEAVAQLQHPNVVQLFEAGQHEGLPYFTLEFISGGSLADRLREGPLPPREAAELVRQIALGVQHAHERGIVHRDLKPANVLLASGNREPSEGPSSAEGSRPPLADLAKVTDFGLARRVDVGSGLTVTGVIMGTPSYMAPEQANGSRDVGPAADVYALGAIFYECLTGRPPFRAATPLDTILQVVSDDPAPPRQLNGSVPRDLEAVCLKCLHKDPQRRYARAAAVAEDLTRFLEGEPVSAQQSGLIDRLTGALDRVQLQTRFASYSSLLFWLAPLMFLPEVWVTLVVANNWSGHLLGVAQFGRAIGFLVLVGYHRGWRWWPQGAAERQLWAVWGGYLVGCFVLGLSGRLAHGFVDTALELRFYQGLTVLAALAFFSLAANFWGYCALIGVAFLGLAFAMAADLRWAPLEFGTLWAVVLLLLGLRLRQMGNKPA